MRFAGYDMGIVAEISQIVKRSRGELRPQDVLPGPLLTSMAKDSWWPKRLLQVDWPAWLVVPILAQALLTQPEPWLRAWNSLRPVSSCASS
jgi:hypothetical protein